MNVKKLLFQAVSQVHFYNMPFDQYSLPVQLKFKIHYVLVLSTISPTLYVLTLLLLV